MPTKKYTFEELQNLKKGTEDFHYYTFPGNDDFKIALRPLTQAETSECVSDGRKKCEDKMFKPTTSDYVDFQAAELIYRSVHEAEDHEKTFFPSAEDVLDLAPDCMAKLIEYYTEVQAFHSVDKDISSEAEFNAYIDDVKKNSPHGMSLSTHMLRKLLLFTVNQLENLQKANGSMSSPSNKLDKTTNENSPEEQDSPKKQIEVTTTIENL